MSGLEKTSPSVFPSITPLTVLNSDNFSSKFIEFSQTNSPESRSIIKADML